jgi:hypothetical protein
MLAMLFEIGILLAMAGDSASPAVADDAALPKTFNVARCALEYKPEAGAARFGARVQYRLVTDGLGMVTSVEETASSPSPPPLRPEFKSLERCLKSWRLEPSTDYTAEVTWGSGVPKASWRVCRRAGGCIVLSEVP